MLIVHLDTHRHIDHSRYSASYSDSGHKGQPLHLVLEKLHLIVVLGGIFDVVEIVRGCVHRAGEHVPHLNLHHQRQCDQKY